ncbi:MAG TPA: site-2 protease family protein [Candidatus Angelobacter sp.]|nr:site-2 protease family protein [Candidatus Angelobacter sp.]
MPENPPPQLEYQIYDPERREIRVMVVQPPKRRYWLHALLFVATLLSTLCIGARLQFDFNRNAWPFADDDHALPWSWALADWNHRLVLGVPFALCLLAILTAHEFGHYILCRRRGVLATLPFFIPFPSLFGTLGAVIRIRSPIHNRKDLFDIGIAGPIAGFLVAVPILFVALMVSKPLTIAPGEGWPVLGFPIIFRVAGWLLGALGSHVAAAQMSAAHLYLAPIGVAAWVGMLATALNLLPGGQLDGGHIVFALNPRAHIWISRLCILVLLFFSWFFSISWLLWAIVLRVTIRAYPIVPPNPGLPLRSRVLSVAAALMLLLTLTPAPIEGPTVQDAINKGREMVHNYLHPSKQR